MLPGRKCRGKTDYILMIFQKLYLLEKSHDRNHFAKTRPGLFPTGEITTKIQKISLFLVRGHGPIS